MNKNKRVYYELQPEVLGEPSLKLDGEDNQDIRQFAKIICEHTGIPEDKIESMIYKFGIEEVLKNPSLICVTKDQEHTKYSLSYKSAKYVLKYSPAFVELFNS